MRDVSKGGGGVVVGGLQKNVHMTFLVGQNRYVTLPSDMIKTRVRVFIKNIHN